MSKQPEFLILKQPTGWLPERFWKNILGAIVLNPHSPTNAYSPKHPPLDQNDLLEDTFDEFILRKESETSSFCKVEINGLGKLHWQKSAGNALDLRGKFVYVKRLTNHPDFWDMVMVEDPDTALKVTEWVNQKKSKIRRAHEVCWVVGLLICQDVAVASSEADVQKWLARGDIQLGTVMQATGVPAGGVGNASAQAGTQNFQRAFFQTAGREKYVFALELKVVECRGGKPYPSDKSPKSKPNQKLGSDEGEVQPEDLDLCDVTEEIWAQLVDTDM